MTRASRHSLSSTAARASLFAAVCVTALGTMPAHALYKVVGPDGKVTYTDRPALGKENKVENVTPMTSGGLADTSSLPFDLQQVVRRYPVTLYTARDCGPCDSGRQLLRQRGVPFVERTINSEADSAELRRLVGKNDLPSISIGAQVVNGFAPAEWASYLDAAGYPKTSRLPSSYSEGRATPLTEPRAAPAPAPAPRPDSPAPAPATPAPAPAPSPTGIRF